jgi:hypothetical protein
MLDDPLGYRLLLPSSNWWNEDISAAPVDPNSDAFISFIGATPQASRFFPASCGMTMCTAARRFSMHFA